MRALPGVRLAGAASGLPLAVSSGDWGFDIEGRSRVNGRRPGAADWFVVTPGYFEALGVPLRRGRLPGRLRHERGAAGRVHQRSDRARAVCQRPTPIGKRIRLSQTTGAEQPWRTIAGDRRRRPSSRARLIAAHRDVHPRPAVPALLGGRAGARHEPRHQDRSAIRRRACRGLRAAVRGLDPDVPAAQVRDMSAILSRVGCRPPAERAAHRRLRRAGAGARRDRPLRRHGVHRVAADARDGRAHGVRRDARARSCRLWSATRSASSPPAWSIGLGCRSLVTGSLARLLFDVGPRDVTIYAVAPAVLVMTAVAASYLPARRATRVDPVIALRAEYLVRASFSRRLRPLPGCARARPSTRRSRARAPRPTGG